MRSILFRKNLVPACGWTRFLLLAGIALLVAGGPGAIVVQGSPTTFYVSANALCTNTPCFSPVSISGSFTIDLTTGVVSSATMSLIDPSDLASSPVSLPLNSQSQFPPNQTLFFRRPTETGPISYVELIFPFNSFASTYAGGPLCTESYKASCVVLSGAEFGANDESAALLAATGGNADSIILINGTVSLTPPGPPNPAPLLYPLVPSATAPGGPAFTLAVNGTGFVAGAIVNWNGTPLTTTFVSGSQVTAAVPAANIATAGTAVITVTNPAPGGGPSNSEDFEITNALTATNFTVFENNEIDGYRSRTSNTLAGYFTGNGNLDLVAYANGFIYVLPGNGDGTFGSWISSPGPPAPSSSTNPYTYLATADLNGDGTPDLVLMNANGTFVALGNGGSPGRFQLVKTSLTDVISNGYVVIADLNGDGFLDLAYTSMTASGFPSIQVQLGNGDGTFRTGPTTVFQRDPNKPGNFVLGTFAAADFNGDGKLDLLVSAYWGACIGPAYYLLEYPGNGDGSFGSPSVVPGTDRTDACPTAGNPSAIVGDFNGDGKLDVAFYSTSNVFGVLGYLTVDLGNGDGTFQLPYQPPAQQVPTVVIDPMLSGDFNGDGKLDLVMGNQLFYGNGDGTFTPVGPPSSTLQLIQAGDFNGDGKVDLLALQTNPSNSNQQDLRLLTQIPAPPDFGGGITPVSQTIVPGTSGNYTGQVTALNGFTGNVALSASGMPTGVTASFNPATVTGGSGSYTMTVSVASTVPIGTYSITVTGTSGTLVHSTSITLIVNSSPGDFSSTLTSDSMQDIVAGQTATYNIQVSPIGGYNGDVSYSVSGVGLNNGQTLPATATFNPSTVHGASGTTTLTIATTNPIAVPDVYVLTITATSGALVHKGVVYLGISNSAGDFTGSITPSSQTISVGQVATYAANITYLNGFTPSGGSSCIRLSVSGVPAGASFKVISNSGCGTSGGETDTFTISAPVGTPTGTYPLLLIGNAGDRIRAGAFSLTIQ